MACAQIGPSLAKGGTDVTVGVLVVAYPHPPTLPKCESRGKGVAQETPPLVVNKNSETTRDVETFGGF